MLLNRLRDLFLTCSVTLKSRFELLNKWENAAVCVTAIQLWVILKPWLHWMVSVE